MKILIDHNLKPSIFRLLQKVGFDAESARFNGMENLTNGMLSAEAHRRGFQCILTQDRTFLNDASKVLAALPTLAIVLVDTSMLPQMPRDTYLARFEHARTHSRANQTCWR